MMSHVIWLFDYLHDCLYVCMIICVYNNATGDGCAIATRRYGHRGWLGQHATIIPGTTTATVSGTTISTITITITTISTITYVSTTHTCLCSSRTLPRPPTALLLETVLDPVTKQKKNQYTLCTHINGSMLSTRSRALPWHTLSYYHDTPSHTIMTHPCRYPYDKPFPLILTHNTQHILSHTSRHNFTLCQHLLTLPRHIFAGIHTTSAANCSNMRDSQTALILTGNPCHPPFDWEFDWQLMPPPIWLRIWPAAHATTHLTENLTGNPCHLTKSLIRNHFTTNY